ncbi:MAG: phosphoribosyltransferase [Pseudomonadota bacterium]
MRYILYLSGVKSDIILRFKEYYINVNHMVVNSHFHNIDQENLIDISIADASEVLIVQSLFPANDCFIELMNLLLQLYSRKIKISVLILYCAYGHRMNGIKDFILTSISQYCTQILALDLNTSNKLVNNIGIDEVLYQYFITIDMQNSILGGVDYRSLAIVKRIAMKLNIDYVFLNKHNDDIPFIADSISTIHIIDDVLYTGSSIDKVIYKCNKLGIAEKKVYVTHKLTHGRSDVIYYVFNNHCVNNDNDIFLSWRQILQSLDEYITFQ